MTVNYREDRILATASELRPGDIDRLNKILEDAGLGRPLRHPEAGSLAASVSDLAVLPVVGADPLAVRDAVRAFIRQGGGELPTLVLDSQYRAGTVEDGARETPLFSASGKKSGHGTIAWLSAPDYEMPTPQPWQQQSDRRPVIALLDSGVRRHDWLPDPAGSPPFVVDAAQHGWSGPVLDDDPDDSHWGHATFIAGLIRLAAPKAQVLSMKVMSSKGNVNESDVVNALNWLAAPGHPDVTADIVLMAFGRHADPDDTGLDTVKAAISQLTRVRIVVSAGNHGSERPCFPAAFAADASLSVVSVGALASATERAPYSNYGPWVREWRGGTNIISTMPVTTQDIGEQRVTARTSFGPYAVSSTANGYAWWSGTSFAAAIYAGQLAQRMSAAQALPEPGAAP
jgi:subtilisin family serine protease